MKMCAKRFRAVRLRGPFLVLATLPHLMSIQQRRLDGAASAFSGWSTFGFGFKFGFCKCELDFVFSLTFEIIQEVQLEFYSCVSSVLRG